MLITTAGVLVRTRVSEIREMGRATQGVTLINIDDDSSLSGVRRVAERDVDVLDDDDQDSGGASDGGGGGAGDALCCVPGIFPPDPRLCRWRCWTTPRRK